MKAIIGANYATELDALHVESGHRNKRIYVSEERQRVTDRNPIHLITAYGKDCGEIVKTSFEDTYQGIDFYYVWVKRPEDEEPED